MELIDILVEILNTSNVVKKAVVKKDRNVLEYCLNCLEEDANDDWGFCYTNKNDNFVNLGIVNGLYPLVFGIVNSVETTIIDDYIADYYPEITRVDEFENHPEILFQYCIFEYKGETYKLNKQGFYRITDTEPTSAEE